MTGEEYAELEKKLKFRAFTVSRLAECDFTEAVRGRLIGALEDGETVGQSWKYIEAMMDDWGINFAPNYWETVYRTNIQSAYNAGRLMQYKDNEPPAWELLFIEDGRTSHICKGLASIAGHGAIPADHNFWKTYGFPPYHYNCRTTFRAVYNDENYETPKINPTMKSIRKAFKPQLGFGGNLIKGAEPKQHEIEIAKILNEYGHEVLFTPENNFLQGKTLKV